MVDYTKIKLGKMYIEFLRNVLTAQQVSCGSLIRETKKMQQQRFKLVLVASCDASACSKEACTRGCPPRVLMHM